MSQNVKKTCDLRLRRARSGPSAPIFRPNFSESPLLSKDATLSILTPHVTLCYVSFKLLPPRSVKPFMDDLKYVQKQGAGGSERARLDRKFIPTHFLDSLTESIDRSIDQKAESNVWPKTKSPKRAEIVGLSLPHARTDQISIFLF